MKKFGIDDLVIIIGTIIFVLGIVLNNTILFLTGFTAICILVGIECGIVLFPRLKDKGDSESEEL